MKRTLILFMLCSPWLYATHPPTQDLKDNMQSIAKSFSHIVTKILVENISKDKKLKKDIDNIQKRISSLESHFFSDMKKYKYSAKSFKALINHFDQIYDNADLDYKKNMVISMAKNCFQCHSHDKIQASFEVNTSKMNNETKALFYSVTRNYDKAENALNAYFKNLVNNKARNIDNLFTMEQELYLQVLNSPQKLQKRYLKRLKNKDVSSEYKKKVQVWQLAIKSLPQYKNKEAIFAASENFIKNRIGLFASDSDKIRILHLIGQLNEELADADRKEVPLILYYLGALENRIDHQYYSIDNLYLIDCMENYTDSPYSQRCLNEFLEQVEFSFTGTAGSSIPDDVQLYIDKVKKKVKKK
ncbi:MAG: hypothetical protein H6621_02580 [Halobacteriovoraceae bacterium]|nr:hypothetical protein [Halobacteriovoraceae bacterium]MCB9093929.1 hypothetical protein [Halobacteriovoraceae bacterium]